MNCKQTRKMIVDYVNGYLEPHKSQKLKEHISVCEDCRQELRELEYIFKLIDESKVEYPPEAVWRNFLPDLHKRIQKEAAVIFNKQQKQRLYFFPGWLAVTATLVLIILASAMLWDNTNSGSLKVQKTYTRENSTSNSESIIIAGKISEILITESEAAEIEKLENFINTEPIFLYHQEEDYNTGTPDANQDAKSIENNEGYIEFMLEKGFEYMGGGSITDSEYYDFEKM